MKRIQCLISLAGLAMLCGCGSSSYNNIRSYHDQFKGTNSLVLKQMLKPQEDRIGVTNVEVTYERLRSLTEEKANVYFVFYRGTNTFNIDSRGFMEIHGQTFETEATNMQTEFKSQVNTSSSTTTTVDSSRVVTTMDNSSNTVNWINDKFKVELTPEMIQALKKADSGNIVIRFYSGATPVTINVWGDQRKKLHELMTAII